MTTSTSTSSYFFYWQDGDKDKREIARQLGLDRKTVRRWCQRWQRGREGWLSGPDLCVVPIS